MYTDLHRSRSTQILLCDNIIFAQSDDIIFKYTSYLDSQIFNIFSCNFLLISPKLSNIGCFPLKYIKLSSLCTICLFNGFKNIEWFGRYEERTTQQIVQTFMNLD